MTENNQTSRNQSDKPYSDIEKLIEGKRLSATQLDSLEIIYPGTRNSSLLNEYRNLRTNLLNKTQNNNFICLIASLAKDGSAASLAVNLASAISFDPTKTSIIVDCDMRPSLIDSVINKNTSPGLMDFLQNNQVPVANIIHQSGIERLRIIPRGTNTARAAEYFSSNAMKILFSHLKKRYSDRFIIVNCPDISLTSEINIVSDVCDMVIFDVPYGKVDLTTIRSSIDLVGEDKLAGLVYSD